MRRTLILGSMMAFCSPWLMASAYEDISSDPPIFQEEDPIIATPLDKAQNSRDHSEDRIIRLEDELRALRGQVEDLHHQLKVTRPPQSDTSDILSAERLNAKTTLGNAEADILSSRSPKDDSAVSKYEEAQEFLSQHAYSEAERVLKDLIERFPKDPLIINARYWLAETYYIQKDYSRAAIAFAEVYKIYRTFKKEGETSAKADLKISLTKVPEALIKLAISLKAMDKKPQACMALEQLHQEFPQLPSNIQKMAENVELELPQCKKDAKK